MWGSGARAPEVQPWFYFFCCVIPSTPVTSSPEMGSIQHLSQQEGFELVGGYTMNVQQIPLLRPRPHPWESPPQWGTQVIQGQCPRWGLDCEVSERGSTEEPQEDFLEEEEPGVSPKMKERNDSAPERENHTHKGHRGDVNAVGTEDGETEPAWLGRGSTD